MAVNLVKSNSNASDFTLIPLLGFIILSFFFSKLLAHAALLIGILIGNIVGFSIERIGSSSAEQVPKKPPDKAVCHQSHWLMIAIGIAMVAIPTTNAFILGPSIHHSKHLSRISNDETMVAALSNNERQSQSKQHSYNAWIGDDIDDSTNSNTGSLDDEQVSTCIATVDSRSLDLHSNLEDDDRIIVASILHINKSKGNNLCNIGVATRTADKKENVTSHSILRSGTQCIDLVDFNNCNQLPELKSRWQQNINGDAQHAAVAIKLQELKHVPPNGIPQGAGNASSSEDAIACFNNDASNMIVRQVYANDCANLDQDNISIDWFVEKF